MIIFIFSLIYTEICRLKIETAFLNNEFMLEEMNKFILIIITLQVSSISLIINSSRRASPRESVSEQSSLSRLLAKNNAGCDEMYCYA
jgi:hypothetical protein